MIKKEEEKCDKKIGENNNNLNSKDPINNFDNEQDKESDDILDKLGNLSQASDDKSFDSPIIFNRTKTFFHGYNTESRQILYESFIMNNKNINKYDNKLNNTYSSRTMTTKRESRTKSLINIKSNNMNINKKISKFRKNLQRTSYYKIPEKIRNNSCSDFNFNFNNYKNQKYSNLESINEKIVDNKIKENKIAIINKKIENIFSIIKNMKQIDKNLKKKDIKKILNNFLLLKNEANINTNFFESINELLDYIIELLNSIVNNNMKYNNKVGNEKIILKLQNEIKEKEKEIGELINKTNLEKEKLENNYKLNNTEILNLRKENKDLTNKLLNVQKHISKLETNNEILEQKLNSLILEKTSKTINSSTSLRSTFISPGHSKMDQLTQDTSYISQKVGPPIEVKNNQKINDKYNASKKLNLNLIDLLKEINNKLCYYDTFFNKECILNKNKQNLAKNLNSFMDINGLIEEKKMKMVSNEYMRNMEIVFNKIEEFIKDVNGNNSEIKHNLTMKHSSSKVMFKKDKNFKENNNTLSRNNKLANMTKNLKNSNAINIPTRKRTKTINNSCTNFP